jgi:hypothetical protein
MLIRNVIEIEIWVEAAAGSCLFIFKGQVLEVRIKRRVWLIIKRTETRRETVGGVAGHLWMEKENASAVNKSGTIETTRAVE